jgi:GntR family transcriptional regulator, transcriptional repressor for pyruvate dehydrogenase complex
VSRTPEGPGKSGPQLRPPVRSRLYEDLVDRLLEYVVDAALKPGDRLPAERELANRLGVSRASVRQAIVALEVQGIVDSRHGDGIYLRRLGVAGESLNKLLDRRRRLPEILEAREALEVKLAELAALRRTEEDLVAMDAALQRMEADIHANGIGADGDAEFHGAIIAAAKSAVLAQLMSYLSHSIHETRMESLSEPGRPPMSLAAHRRIFLAIRSRDDNGAARAMREHLSVVADVRLLHWESED